MIAKVLIEIQQFNWRIDEEEDEDAVVMKMHR